MYCAAYELKLLSRFDALEIVVRSNRFFEIVFTDDGHETLTCCRFEISERRRDNISATNFGAWM